jgi:hypothetical protein
MDGLHQQNVHPILTFPVDTPEVLVAIWTLNEDHNMMEEDNSIIGEDYSITEEF